jgi:hypothetical protein
MTLVCRPTPIVPFHPVERALLTNSTLGWHLSNDVDAFARRNDLLRNRRNIIQVGRCRRTVLSIAFCRLGAPFIPWLKTRGFLAHICKRARAAARQAGERTCRLDLGRHGRCHSG